MPNIFDMNEESDAIYGVKENYGKQNSLGTISEETGYKGVVEVTLNYPRTASFKRMKKWEQERLYRELLDKVMMRWTAYIMVTNTTFRFETCVSGYVHLHLAIAMHIKQAKFNAYGLIEEFFKLWLSEMPLRYRKQTNLQKSYTAFPRYECPSIVIQYIPETDPARIAEWEVYINKNAH